MVQSRNNIQPEKPNTSSRILVIDDEPGIVDFIELGLGYEGYEVLTASDGKTGLQLALSEIPDLIILDLMLPGIDGFELCQKLRQTSKVPVIMLTARDELDDRVRGLDLGADDYLTKPFQFKELAARIRAVLRRGSNSPEESSEKGSKLLQVQDITLDPALREVRRDSTRIELSLREYELLELLMRHSNQVLPRDTILDRVWGYDFGGDANIIEVYVRYLRQKLGKPNPITTIRGVGYLMKLRQEEEEPD
ncbi:MAG: response regulator transcription factor [Chloroflexi bacterium]|uniref:Response regulator transcription factor n=1 Tax=Candidatus Chlorohelix allophototropha TaxID=3003348 RepID=A0A8T7M6K2_9CHLR|nr:response regulator transcription factor [Chloroflexota bacterium]WJW69606.1 response regulator transcription factor [Chloroflexota bacterium L227-S17]